MRARRMNRNTCRRGYAVIVNLVKCRSIYNGIKGDLGVLVVIAYEIVLYAIFTFLSWESKLHTFPQN